MSHRRHAAPAVRLLLAVALLSPTAALADKGMPQLDFANPLTISQVVWLVVVFGVLYAALSTWALPRVGAVVEDRARRIATDLDSARAARDAADVAVREAQAASRRAHAEAQTEINDAVQAAKLQAAERAASQRAALDLRMAAADARITAARASAMASLRDVATNVATAMIERLSGKAADPHAVAAAVGPLLPPQAS